MVWHPPGPDRPAARPTHPTAHPDHEEHVDSDPNGDRSSDVDQHRRDFLSAVPPTQPRREAGHCHPAWAKSTSAVQCPSRARVLMTGPSARTAMAYRHFLGVYPTGCADRTTHVEDVKCGIGGATHVREFVVVPSRVDQRLRSGHAGRSAVNDLGRSRRHLRVTGQTVDETCSSPTARIPRARIDKRVDAERVR